VRSLRDRSLRRALQVNGGVSQAKPVSLETLNLRKALLNGVAAHGEQELELDLCLADGSGSQDGGAEVTVRFSGITNFANVRRFFFGYRAKEREEGLDQVVEAKHTRVGWSIELADRGRVSIKTMEVPTVKRRAR